MTAAANLLRTTFLRPTLCRAVAFALSLLLLTGVVACSRQGVTQTGSERVTAIDNVNVLDGRGGPAITNARVLVRDGRIVQITTSNAPMPRDVEVIDGANGYLLPGFIDMHAHLLFPRCGVTDEGSPRFDRALSERALSRQLDFGITMVRSPGNPTVDGLALRDDLNAGRVRGPRALASAELINDASMTEAQLRQYVLDALPYRPDYFKVYARLRPEQVASVIDEAHRHGLPVIGHLNTTSWAEGVELGVDHLVHSVDWSVESLPPARRSSYEQARQGRSAFRARIDWLEHFDPDAPEQRKLIADLARKRVSVDVTLIAYDGKFAPPEDGRYRRNPHLDPFPDLRGDWETCSDATADWTDDDYRRWSAARPTLSKWIKRMSDGGVLLTTGTDLTNEWIIPGEGLHQEFELLAAAGLSPDRILRMTGANAAKAMNLTDVGVVEAGRRADLVLLSADPRRDIRNTRKIAWVMQGGQLVFRAPRRLAP